MNRISKLLALCLAAALMLTGVVAGAEEQTAFNIISGISALSGGYDDNPVLKQLQEEAGITINWDLSLIHI